MHHGKRMARQQDHRCNKRNVTISVSSSLNDSMSSCSHRTKLQKQAVLSFKPVAFRRTVIDKSKVILRVKPLNPEDSKTAHRPSRCWKKLNTTLSLSYRLKRQDSDGNMSFDEDSDCEFSSRNAPTPSNADYTRSVYKSACKKNNITPSSTFLKSCYGTLSNLNYQGLEPLGTRSVALALVSNLTITDLSLRGNAIGTEGLQCLVDMLRDNCNLKSLDISENNLSTEGAPLVAKILKENETLTSLSLGGNKFREGDIQPIADALTANTTLKSLDLSYNELSEEGGIIIGRGLAGNDALTDVNLGWNHLRQTGVRGVAEGLKENGSIRLLDLSWNGIGDFGARLLGQVLKENTTLQVLNLSSCRIGMDGVGFLMTEMVGNETLRQVILCKNPITSHGACAFLQVLKNTPSLGIDMLDISDISVTQEFMELLDEIRETRPDFEAKHGGTLRGKDSYIHRVVKKLTLEDPLDVLLNYVKSNGLRLMDLFQRFDRDKSHGITREEFIQGIKKANLPLNLIHIENLIDRLDEDKDGVVDFGELMEGRQNHLMKKRKQMTTKGLPGSRSPKTSPSSSPCTSPRVIKKKGSIFKFSSLLGNPEDIHLKASSPDHQDEGEDIAVPVPILNKS